MTVFHRLNNHFPLWIALTAFGRRRPATEYLWALVLVSALILGSRPLVAQERRPVPLNEVIENGRLKEKVLIRGRVERSHDFDHFSVAEGTSTLVVSFVGVAHDLKKGDDILVYGRFRGRREFQSRFALVEAIQFAIAGDSENWNKLIEAYGKTPEPVTGPAPVAKSQPEKTPLFHPSVEDRLKELDNLKSKKLITDEEYKATRQKILSDL